MAGRILDPLLAGVSRPSSGVYKPDNVLLGPGRWCGCIQSTQCSKELEIRWNRPCIKALFTPAQVATLQQADCSLQFLTDHTFAISNLPAADFSSNILITGSWSLSVYHVFETYGYRISMKGEPKGGLAMSKFLNGDKP